ncbi:MAG: arylesterase [Lachnospiraceae bacterium]|nr:arylesterase [Lachnospiraceae bacterium]
MESILVYGDSNTWGLIPGSSPHKRYPFDIRWTGVLQKKLKGIRILEEGLCGRTTVFDDKLRAGRNGFYVLPVILESQCPIDNAIIMLGTNDCKRIYGATSYVIGKGMERCLDVLESYVRKERILLISPIELGGNVWRPEKDPEFDERSVRTSKELKAIYEGIAKKRGINFLAASDYVAADDKDDEHLNEDGHVIFANAVYEKLKAMGVL